MSCRLLFEELTNDRSKTKERADLIDKQYPDGYCERESVSIYSQGRVEEEYIHRFVFSPIHLKDGKVLPALFSDAKDKGLSCERSYTEQASEDVHQRGTAQADRWNDANADHPLKRSYLGVVTSHSKAVRSILVENERSFAIYDTGLSENSKHVDVFEIAGRTNSQRKLARKALADAFTKVPVAS